MRRANLYTEIFSHNVFFLIPLKLLSSSYNIREANNKSISKNAKWIQMILKIITNSKLSHDLPYTFIQLILHHF